MNLNKPISIADCLGIINEYRNIPGECIQSTLATNMESAATLASERIRSIMVEEKKDRAVKDAALAWYEEQRENLKRNKSK